MSNLSDYQALLETVQAIPEKDLIIPDNIPSKNFIHECETLYQTARKDKADLLGAGLDEEFIDTLLTRCGALRHAESIWVTGRYSKEDAQEDWEEKSEIAVKMRSDLIAACRYAFRNRSDLEGRVDAIAEGSGGVDLIQDLSDLSVLGKENSALLEKIKFDLTKLDTAATMSDEYGTIFAIATSDKDEKSDKIDLRNRFYTYLKKADKEIKDCGKYVYRDNEKKKRKYTSEYLRRKRKK